MFDSKQTLTTRLADATDLLIDFATLGEYGLEPVGSTRRGCVDPSRTRPMPIADRRTFAEILFRKHGELARSKDADGRLHVVGVDGQGGAARVTGQVTGSTSAGRSKK